jgi:acyl-CoA thioesterase-2
VRYSSCTAGAAPDRRPLILLMAVDPQPRQRLTASTLEQTLALDQVAGCDIFVGQPRKESVGAATRTHLFGGLIAAQSVVAAGRTVLPTHRIHSLHSYFILAGDGRMPILYNVTRVRDGRSFATRQVTAMQENKPIFMMMASFHTDEPGPEFQRPPEQLHRLLGDLLPRSGGRVPSTSELHRDGQRATGLVTQTLPVLSGLNHSLAYHKHATQVGHNERGEALEIGAPTSRVNNWVMHSALLAYMSDEGLMSTIRQPYAKKDPSMVIAMSFSLDHTIHFHRPFRADEWLLFHNETTCSAGGRGVARTEVWDDQGLLVASFLQEGLLRPPKSWKPGATVSLIGAGGLVLLRNGQTQLLGSLW